MSCRSGAHAGSEIRWESSKRGQFNGKDRKREIKKERLKERKKERKRDVHWDCSGLQQYRHVIDADLGE